MMRGVFFTFYTKITKLFPQCWPGNTKVFNIFSTFGGFPARSTLFSALIAHFQHLTGAHHQRVFGRVEFLLCAHYLPAHAAVKSQCPGVGVQHRKHRVLMLWQLLPGEIQHLLADAPAPGALRHKKMLHLPGLVVYADRGIRHILGIVEVADPAFLLFLLQLGQEHLRGQGIQRFLHPAPGTNAPTALRKQLCGSLHLLSGLDQPDILAPLPLGDLGQGMGLTPLLVELRAAQTGALPALLPPPGIDLLVVALQQDRRHSTALPDLGPGVPSQ